MNKLYWTFYFVCYHMCIIITGHLIFWFQSMVCEFVSVPFYVFLIYSNCLLINAHEELVFFFIIVFFCVVFWGVFKVL